MGSRITKFAYLSWCELRNICRAKNVGKKLKGILSQESGDCRLQFATQEQVPSLLRQETPNPSFFLAFLLMVSPYEAIYSFISPPLFFSTVKAALTWKFSLCDGKRENDLEGIIVVNNSY